MKKYVELRLRRDFGGVITAFLDFVKINIKGMFNTFINYNAILLILVFISSFFLSSGFATMSRAQVALIENNSTAVSMLDEMTLYFIGIGMMLFTIFLAMMINSALSGSYIKVYEELKVNNPDRKLVYRAFKKKIGGVILLSILAVIIFFVVYFVAILMAMTLILIPVSFLALIMFFTWIGMSMFAYSYHDNASIGDAMGKAWKLMFSKFWTAIGFSFVVTILIYVVMSGMQMIPNLINWYYMFNSIENSSEEIGMAFQIFFFVFSSISMILSMFAFYLIQTSMGILYTDLHEHQYNEHLRTRIEQLGQHS